MQIRVVHLISKIDKIKHELEEIEEIKKRLRSNRNYSKRIYKALEEESIILKKLHKTICSQIIKAPLPPHLEALVKKEIEKSKRIDAPSSADAVPPTPVRPTVYLPTETKEKMTGDKVNQKPTFATTLKTGSPSTGASAAKDSPTKKPSLKDSSTKAAPQESQEESQIVDLTDQNRAGIEEMVEQEERKEQEEKKREEEKREPEERKEQEKKRQLASDRIKKDFPFTFE